ncbi:hypothetical protein D3C73_1608420 [compost metagenome]
MFNYRINGAFDEFGRIVKNGELHSFRELALNFLHRFTDVIRYSDGIAVGLLLHRQTNALLAVTA